MMAVFFYFWDNFIQVNKIKREQNNNSNNKNSHQTEETF